MNTPLMTPAQANIELFLLSAEAEATTSSDLYAWLRDSGLPSEAAIRLKELVEVTESVGGRLVSIGKIVLIKILEFIKTHPNLAIGIAIGAAIGAIVSMIPFLGTYLWPVAAAVGVSIGAVAGHRLDKSAVGQRGKVELNLITVSQDVIEIAKAFFQMLIDIVTMALDEKSLKGA